MSTKLIKKTLIKKGYELLDLKLLRGNDVCETEWLFLVPLEQRQKIIELGCDFFCQQDFSDGYLGGNSDYIEECLEMLPDLKEQSQ
ncbi:hypothetical protein AZG96_RS15590 [Acinetobacter baumannii]|nr:hypothetical protein [Acinetobacter baumannii]